MIRCQNLSFRYGRRSTDGISGLSFELKEKSITALIGPSGAGKTTLLKCLYGDIAEFSGKIDIDSDQKISFLKNIQLESSKLNLFDYLNAELDEAVEKEQRINQLRSILAEMDLTNEIETPLSHLSSGQKQRALIAKALINNPTILLLDEPFANLDNNLRNLMLNEFFTLLRSKDITIVWVTHNTDEALMYADEVMLLNFGNMEQMATPREMYFAPQSIFAAQFFGANNILPATLLSQKEDIVRATILGQEMIFKTDLKIPFENFLVMLRPEYISLSADATHTEQEFSGIIMERIFEGRTTLYKVEVEDKVIAIRMLGHTSYNINDTVFINLNTEEIFPLIN